MSESKYTLKYYKDIPKGIKVTAQDNIDPDRWDKICNTATADVKNGLPKKKESDFKSKGEYNLYLLSVYGVACSMEAGLM